MEFLSLSVKDTQKFAQKLSKRFKNKGGLVALIGELGAGKTTFTQGFAKGLGIKERILSPTFILMRQYKVPNSKKKFYHIDLYRLFEKKDFVLLGLKELIDTPQNIVLIEWAEKIKELLHENSIIIYIDKVSEEKRLFRVYY